MLAPQWIVGLRRCARRASDRIPACTGLTLYPVTDGRLRAFTPGQLPWDCALTCRAEPVCLSIMAPFLVNALGLSCYGKIIGKIG